MRKNKKPILLPIILLLAVVALSIGGVILAQNLRRARIENPGEIVNEDNIPRITAEEAYQAYTNRETIIVDTRSESSYANQHIAGAVNIPLEQIEERMGEMDPSKWVITYCTWPNENTSARAAFILLQNGFTKANPILGGLEAWIEAGYPLEP